LFPTLETEKIELLHRAIIESSAAEYKRELLKGDEFPRIHNALNDSTADWVSLLQGPEESQEKLLRFLSTMANQQIRLQERDLADRLGRSYAMFHDIPLQFGDELSERLGGKFLDLSVAVQQRLGLTVREFLLLGFGLITLMGRRYNSNFCVSPELRKTTAHSEPGYIASHARVIADIIDKSKDIQVNLIFRAEDLVDPKSLVFCIENVHKYLDLLSKTTLELRQMLRSETTFTIGSVPDRLSPLERYPIVRLTENRYIIPNLRHFDTAATDVIHFVLQDLYPDNTYNQLRGHIQ
jgi:hypothetical protein